MNLRSWFGFDEVAKATEWSLYIGFVLIGFAMWGHMSVDVQMGLAVAKAVFWTGTVVMSLGVLLDVICWSTGNQKEGVPL